MLLAMLKLPALLIYRVRGVKFMSNNANIDLGIVIQKLTKQIGELVLQNTLLQTQIEMLLQKPQQTVESNEDVEAQ